MLPDYLVAFNISLEQFQQKYPRGKWTEEFKTSLVNDYSFFSARVEDSKLQYGDTIRFLNDESIRGVNLQSLLAVSEHQTVLKNLIINIADFSLTEETLKGVHASLMDSQFAWESEFNPELVGNYRNIPTVGSREPFFENKEYAPHYNLEISMASHMDIFNNYFDDIDNSISDKHLITRLAFFHNKFLNEIHPFADGNGRVCRIVMGVIMMKNNCPPVFPQIIGQEQQFEYINTIVSCEKEGNDEPLIGYFAREMTSYLAKRLKDQ
jgi:Fic family protein